MAQDATAGGTSAGAGLLDAEVVEATKGSSDLATQTPRVGVVLPNAAGGIAFLRELDESVGHEIHILSSPSFQNMADPFTVDAGQVVKEVANYVQCESLQGLTSLMCFPSLIQAAAIQTVNKTAPKKLHGPSFDSVALCCNKLLMRKLVEGACDRERLQILDPRDLNGSAASESERLARLRGKLPDFPLCIKFADTQFYVGTFRLDTWEELEIFLNGSAVFQRYVRWVLLEGGHAHGHDVEEFIKFHKRQEFYFAHLSGELREKLTLTAPSDISLFHFEEWISNGSYPGMREYQVEVVVAGPSQVFVHDTGDIVHDTAAHCLTLFHTPFSLGPDVPKLHGFLKGVVDSLTKWGWQHGAMDIEFKSTRDGTVMELIEVNSRYSFMGWHQYELDREHGKGHMTTRSLNTYNEKYAEHIPESAAGHEHHSSMRNIENRLAASLGKQPSIFPARDHEGISVLAAFFYTSEKGELKSIFDAEAVKELVNQFIPKPLAKPGEITDADCVQYHGWCKVGCLIDCIEDDPQFINEHLERVYKAAFKPRPGAKYLMPRLAEESKQLPLRYLQDIRATVQEERSSPSPSPPAPPSGRSGPNGRGPHSPEPSQERSGPSPSPPSPPSGRSGPNGRGLHGPEHKQARDRSLRGAAYPAPRAEAALGASRGATALISRVSGGHTLLSIRVDRLAEDRLGIRLDEHLVLTGVNTPDASALGWRVGDVILKANGKRLRERYELREFLSSTPLPVFFEVARLA